MTSKDGHNARTNSNAQGATVLFMALLCSFHRLETREDSVRKTVINKTGLSPLFLSISWIPQLYLLITPCRGYTKHQWLHEHEFATHRR
jgi:hypothetical protein